MQPIDGSSSSSGGGCGGGGGGDRQLSCQPASGDRMMTQPDLLLTAAAATPSTAAAAAGCKRITPSSHPGMAAAAATNRDIQPCDCSASVVPQLLLDNAQLAALLAELHSSQGGLRAAAAAAAASVGRLDDIMQEAFHCLQVKVLVIFHDQSVVCCILWLVRLYVCGAAAAAAAAAASVMRVSLAAWDVMCCTCFPLNCW
jgi:hypothetical protein